MSIIHHLAPTPLFLTPAPLPTKQRSPTLPTAYEVRNSVLVGLRRGRISKTDAEGFLESLEDLNIHLTDPKSYDAVFKLAERSGLTVYDASYLDLVIREGTPLASLDDALRKATVRAGGSLYERTKAERRFGRFGKRLNIEVEEEPDRRWKR